MDEALGPPEKMRRHADDLTPMLSQYFELCREYDDALVLFQVGDFYEAFCGAAERIARLLEITLTQREDSTGEWPMAGIPVENAESYVETLLDAGYRVAIADQVEDPDEVTGVVERAVTRIVTPGTLTEDELLDTDANTYTACLARTDERYGLAFLDVSTGAFVATSTRDPETVSAEVERFAPAEALVGPDADADVFGPDCMVTPFREAAFGADRARDRLGDYFGDPDALLAGDAEVRACGALLAYAEYARGGQDGRLDYLNHLRRYDPREYMVLDAAARSSLELFERRGVHGAPDAALVDVVDETSSALGSRRLKEWLRRPLLDADEMRARHAAVADLQGDVATRERLAELLREVYDLERLVSRVSRGRADARDLRSLAGTLAVVPDVREALADAEAPLLVDVRENLDPLADVRDRVESAIRPDPPAELTEGDLIREGYDETLDDLRATEREGKAWVDDLEARERERTGIDSLKVGFNAVHGYYIEVTNPNLDRVPEDYTRRQTLKNSERFYTPELKEREDEILRAEQRADDLELDLFREVRDAVAAESARVQALADRLATLDALVSFADVAAAYDYCRPAVGADAIDVEAGRHPVVERTEDAFVPNDTRLGDDARLAVITGPNMSGKSTYMRQVALIQILAQAGSFVPAESASLPVVDRVFTRVGASDDIAGGRSTFMVEMTELATILRSATPDSLVLLDEVGRGTSTADGLAIAEATTEHLLSSVGACCLFATHHHDLTGTAARLEGACNRHFAATRVDGSVTFDHELRDGPAEASYGVEVAEMAGVPDAVVDSARDAVADPDAGDPATAPAADGGAPPAALDRIREADLADTTPFEALQLLHELQREL